jgi:hypothetical protein
MSQLAHLYDALHPAVARYLITIAAIWGLFSFPERLLKEDVLKKIAALVSSPETTPTAQRLFSALVAVVDSVFHFRPVAGGAFFLPSVKRLLVVYLCISVIGAAVFLFFVAKSISLGPFFTQDVPVLTVLTALAFIYALPFDYVSVTFTRLVFESGRPEQGRLAAALFLVGDIIWKIWLVLWCYYLYGQTIPYWTRYLIRGWYVLFPADDHVPWLIAAIVEASQRYGGFYFLILESVSITLLLLWGATFVLAVFVLNGLSPRQRLFWPIIEYVDVNKRPLSLIAFFVILAMTPVYALAYYGVTLIYG